MRKKAVIHILLTVVLFFAILARDINAQTSCFDNIKRSGDYNCDGVISMSDFEDIRRDLMHGEKILSFFEDWRSAFFNKKNPSATIYPTTYQPTLIPTSILSTPTPPLSQGVAEVVAAISETEIRALSTAITSRDDAQGDNRQTRFSTSAGFTEELQFIKNKLSQLGLITQEQSFSTRTTRFGTISSKNLIAKYNGADTQNSIIVSAHLDSVGSLYYSQTGSSNPQDPYTPASSPAPGADDDGSGVVAVYEIARAIAAVRPRLQKSVVFLFYGAEEQGLHGSQYYAARANPSYVHGVFQMDMIGYGPTRDCVKFIYRPNNTAEKNLTDLLMDANSDYSLGLQTAAVAKTIPYSDHASFHQYAMPAVLGADCALIDNVGTVSSRSYYHDNLDTTANINYTQIKKTAQMVAAAVINLANR